MRHSRTAQTPSEHEAERRGYYQGAIMVTILWTIDNVAHPAFWLLLLVALALGTATGLVTRWKRSRALDPHAR